MFHRLVDLLQRCNVRVVKKLYCEIFFIDFIRWKSIRHIRRNNGICVNFFSLFNLSNLTSFEMMHLIDRSHKTHYFAFLERQRDILRNLIRAIVFPKSSFRAKLVVNVIEAHDLPPCDSNGLSDP